MREFGCPTADPEMYFSAYDYVLNQAQSADEHSLVKLYQYFFPDEEGGLDGAQEDANSPWRAGAFRLFISPTSGHKGRASNLAKALAGSEVHGFVAHAMLEPRRESQDDIEEALRTCDALCAILTPAFAQSRWCDQEIGMVVAQRN